MEPVLLAVQHLASYMSMEEVAESLIALAALKPEMSQAEGNHSNERLYCILLYLLEL